MFPKTKPHIFVLLAFLIVSGMIVSPVSATSYTIVYPHGVTTFGDGSGHDVVIEDVTSVDWNGYENSSAILGAIDIYFTNKIGTSVDFTLTYGGNRTVSGSTAFNIGDWPNADVDIELGGNVDNLSYGYVPIIDPDFQKFTIQYGADAEYFLFDVSNDTTPRGILLTQINYGNTPIVNNDLAVLYPTSNPDHDIITRFQATSSEPFTVIIHCGNVSGLSIDNGPGNPLEIVTKWLGIAADLSIALYGFILAVFTWAKFLFVENILLVFGLWIGVTMAFSAVTTVGNGLNIRNLERFYKKFFGYQMVLFRFMMEIWNYLVQIIASFRGIFRI